MTGDKQRVWGDPYFHLSQVLAFGNVEVKTMPEQAAFELIADHRSLSDLLERFKRAMDAGKLETALKLLDFLWARLAVHIRAEHLVLFKALERHCPQSGEHPDPAALAEAIRRLRSDHDLFMEELALAVKTLKSAAEGPDQKLSREQADETSAHVARVERVLDPHNRFEEEQVYGWLDTWVPEPERAAVRRAIQEHLTRLPPRFRT